MSELEKILHVDVWSQLHPATKLIIKILQHVRDKVRDGAEVRAYFDSEEILVTTYRSEVRISRSMVEFKRRGRGGLRVQRIKHIKLSSEVIDEIKKAIVDILEHDCEPNYPLIVDILEKALRPEE